MSGKPNRDLRELTETRLLEKYSATIEQTARTLIDCAPTYVDLEDLVQAGALGLLKAFRRTRAYQKNDDYLRTCIWGSLFDEVRRTAAVPREHLTRAHRASGKDRGPDGAPDDEQRLRTQRAVATAELVARGQSSSQDAEANESGFGTHDQAELAEARQLWALAEKAMNRLPQSERSVLLLYYLRGATMHEIGEVLGVSESRASQLHHIALARLKVRMRRFAS